MASLAQLALDHLTVHFEARIGLVVHSERPRRRERIDPWATIVIAQPASNALSFHVKTAFGPPALRAVDHLAARPTGEKAVAVIEFPDTPTAKAHKPRPRSAEGTVSPLDGNALRRAIGWRPRVEILNDPAVRPKPHERKPQRNLCERA